MQKTYFEIKNDIVIRYTPVLGAGENIYKTDVVMTKEIFQECYKKWVEPQYNENDIKTCEVTTGINESEKDVDVAETVHNMQ